MNSRNTFIKNEVIFLSRFRIVLPGGEILCEITKENPETAKRIVSSLPIQGVGSRWGQEIYTTSTNPEIVLPPEIPREIMEEGEIAYWPPGKALCVFWGPTPASEDDDKPRAASPVNPFAKIIGLSTSDLEKLNMFQSGEVIRFEP